MRQSSDVILWDEQRPLTWNDYRGKPEKRFAAASTTYDILKSVSKNSEHEASVKIQSVFFCDRSWKKNEWISDEILSHEQTHFNIVEVYARKLRKLISERHYTSMEQLRKTTDSLYTVIDKALDAYQDVYDDKTDGSMNGNKQREWNQKIQKELKALDDHRNTTVLITLP